MSVSVRTSGPSMRLGLLAVACAAAFALSGTADAQVIATWGANPATGDWNTGGNWTGGVAPNGLTHTATFGTSTVTAINFSVTGNPTEVGTVTFGAGASRLHHPSPNNNVFRIGTGLLNNSGVVQNFVAGNGLTSSFIEFTNTVTVGSQMAFTMLGGTTTLAGGGSVDFSGSSSAGSATFMNHGTSAGGVSIPGRTNFQGSATAATGTFTNNGGTANNARGGSTDFTTNATAAAGTFTNNAGIVAGQGGFTRFTVSSTAGNATLIANGGVGSGGVIDFRDNSTGGSATVQVFGNGTLDISNHNTGVAIQSLQGSGLVRLGTRNLTLNGSANTTFSGSINGTTADAGSLTLAGTGNFTLTGTSVYRSTVVNGGTLRIVGGGTVQNTGGAPPNAAIGGSAGSVGVAVVVGTGSLWDSDHSVGFSGTGMLSIGNGGRINNSNLILGENVSGIGTVNVLAGGIVTNNAVTVVGNAGTGTLNLTGGTFTATSTGLFVAELAGSTGTVNVGQGTTVGLLNAAEVRGRLGAATLNFNHNQATHFVTRDGTAGGAPILLSGSLRVNHVGSGTTVLTAANTYTGPTTVSAGTLRINGSVASPVAVTGGTLGGTGSIGGAVAVRGGGTLAPGNSIGTLTVNNNVTFGDASGSGNAGTYRVELGGTTTSDGLALTGLNSSLDFLTTGAAVGTGAFIDFGLILGNPFVPFTTYNYPIATTQNAGGILVNGSPTGDLSLLALASNYPSPATLLSRSGSDLVLSFTPIPEPSSALLAAAGVLAVYLRRRRFVKTQRLART